MVEDSDKILWVEYPSGHKMWYRDKETYEEWVKVLNQVCDELEYKLIFGDNGRSK